jgi:hypothetical protein
MTDASTAVPLPTTISAVSAEGRRTLIRLLRVAYPHASFPDGPYERTADAVIAKVEGSVFQALSLAHGLASLDAAAGSSFVDLDDAAAYALLRQVENAEFFKLIRSVAVVSLYNDQETWTILGYEGSSYEHGGYLHRGFDDLDWLPSPRIEEYDGPEEFVEVAPHDMPADHEAPAVTNSPAVSDVPANGGTR